VGVARRIILDDELMAACSAPADLLAHSDDSEFGPLKSTAQLQLMTALRLRLTAGHTVHGTRQQS
jgi:hypothetical protein